MLAFQKTGFHTLEPHTGIVRDPDGVIVSNDKPPAKIEPNIGMPHEEFVRQVTDLKNKPIKDVHAAIDAHPDITDKAKAKEMATAIHSIVSKQKI